MAMSSEQRRGWLLGLIADELCLARIDRKIADPKLASPVLVEESACLERKIVLTRKILGFKYNTSEQV